MIENLDIKNFKSIKHLNFSCKRINVFLGEPNVGKSNLLEALGLFSAHHLRNAPSKDFRQLIRFENFANLFSDEDISNHIEVTAQREKETHLFTISYQHNNYMGEYGVAPAPLSQQMAGGTGKLWRALAFQASSGGINSWSPTSGQVPFKTYKFSILEQYPIQEHNYLLPLDGPNLLFLLRTNPDLYKIADELFKSRGFRLVLRPHENKIEVQNNKDARLILFPYSTVSDTLQRFIFHLAAIMTNKDAVISLEEPESHAFPYYTKQLAERIALDGSGNQFFVSTHNPYFLLPLIEKAPRADLAIFLTTLEDYETKLTLLSDKQVRELADLDFDVFLNFAHFAEK